VTLLALACARPVFADWKRDYDTGIKEFESQNWTQAEASFRSALADESEASARKRFQGTRYDVYVPHYYAGLAAYRQGACARALEYWSNSASSAVVSGIAELASTQRQGIDDCNGRLASTRPPPTAPTPSEKPPVDVQTPPSKPPVAAPPKNPVVSKPPPAQTPPPAPARITAPAALVTAIGHYLGGDYAALERIDPAALDEPRARADAFLMRAAARHTRALLAGSDGALLEKARGDVRAARSAYRALVPDEIAFSPRFRSFWRETR
jgi:hypothetical protein